MLEDNYVYLIDSNRQPIGRERWNGEIRVDENYDGEYLRVVTKKGEDVELQKGDMVHYSGSRADIQGIDYEIIGSDIGCGLYKVKIIE